MWILIWVYIVLYMAVACLAARLFYSSIRNPVIGFDEWAMFIPAAVWPISVPAYFLGKIIKPFARGTIKPFITGGRRRR